MLKSTLKSLSFVLLLTFLFVETRAQYVEISNKYLAETIKEMFPNCVSVNNELDTTCSSLSSVDTLTLLWQIDNFEYDIDMSSLKYFRNLDSLALIFYRNTSLNVLLDFKESPSSLKKLSSTNLEFNFSYASWSFQNLPQGLEEYYGQAEDITFLSTVPNLKKIKVEYIEYLLGGGAINLFFADSTLPENVEILEMKHAIFRLKPKVSNKLKKLVLEDVSEGTGVSINEFLSVLPDGLTDLSLEDIRNDTLNFLQKLPKQLKNLSIISILNQTLSEINLPSGLQSLYIIGGKSKINPLPDSLTSITILNHELDNPLETFSSLPKTLKDFKLNRTPMLLVPDLPPSTVNFEATNARIQSIGQLSPGLLNLNLAVNDIRELPSLPSRLRVLDLRGNPNLSCLPILNDSLRKLNTTFGCIPNATKYITATPNRPICSISDSICEDVSFIKGVMYYDENANGLLDSNELGLSEGMVKVLAGNVFAITGKDGAYTALLTPAETNFVSASYNNPYVESITPSQYEVVAPQAGFVFADYHFAVRFRPAYDLESYITSTTHRPGFSSTVTAIIANRTISEYSNATLKLYCPASLTKVATYPTANRIENDTIYWENISLEQFKSKKFELVVYNSPLIPLGTELVCFSKAESSEVDETPLNNTFEYKTTVRGSYDPNDKLVNVPTILPNYSPDTELIYTIRFQNTGTDTAFNVIVRDSILSTLNPESIRTISSSHDYVMEYNSNGVVDFNFYNIQLPDSNVNEPLSHGYIMLALQPQANLPLGTEILNGASIYFDFNEPIITNLALTAVNANVSTTIRQMGALKVYPNPASQSIRVEHDGVAEMLVRIFNLNGSELYFKEIQDSIIEISVSDFPPGTYIIQSQSSNDISVGKFIIQR
jgi:uncharacterized repeat protein (TIGR01451 family)